MGRKCIVSECRNNSEHPTESVHSFPTEETRRNDWIDFAKNSYVGDITVNKIENYGVCALHFTSDEYLVKDNGRKKLKITAVPASTSDEVAKLKKMLNAVNEELLQLKSSSTRMISMLEKDLKEVKAKLELEKNKTAKLSKFFTSNQTTMLLNPDRKRMQWNQEDILKSLGLFSLSKLAYELVREKWKLPLPSPATLQRHLAEVEIIPNKPIAPVLNILNSQFSSQPFNSLKTQCVIALDEISIDSSYCYDHSLDQVFGEESHINMICARGLFDEWKEPILYSFNFDQETLSLAVSQLHEAGLNVVGVTSDMGPRNQGIWNQLNIGLYEGEAVSSSFKHPISGNNIYWFPDFPHLLKLLRNHFLDYGFTLKVGVTVDKSWIRELIEAQDKYDLRPGHKLSYKHINLEGQERQNVRTAFELFSHTTATLIRTLLKHKPGHKEVADFFDLINDVSDLMNSRNRGDSSNQFKCGYGLRIYDQENLLKKAYQEIWLKIGSRRTHAPFQKGLLMSFTSVQALFSDLTQRLPLFSYLLLYKVNQDFVENLFSQVRGLGRFKVNPNAVDFKYRLKKIMLLWNRFEDSVDDHLFEPSWNSNIYRDDSETVSQNLNCFVRRTPALKSVQEMTANEFCEEGGKEYVAGYIARRFIDMHPEMSSKENGEDSQDLWIVNLEREELTEPSREWFCKFRGFDQVFSALHGKDSIRKCKDVISILVNELVLRYPGVPIDVVKYYARLRTLLRVKHLNRRKEDDKFAWRKE